MNEPEQNRIKSPGHGAIDYQYDVERPGEPASVAPVTQPPTWYPQSNPLVLALLGLIEQGRALDQVLPHAPPSNGAEAAPPRRVHVLDLALLGLIALSRSCSSLVPAPPAPVHDDGARLSDLLR